MVDLKGHRIDEMFGMEQKSKGICYPGYFYMDFDIDRDEEPDNCFDAPPKSGKMTVRYFTTGLEGWRDIFTRLDDGTMNWEEAKKHVKEVEFESFPTAFELWADLIQRLKRKEIKEEDVVEMMLEASAKYQASQISCR